MELISGFFYYRIAHLNAAWLKNDFLAIRKVTSEGRAILTLPEHASTNHRRRYRTERHCQVENPTRKFSERGDETADNGHRLRAPAISYAVRWYLLYLAKAARH
jgi:hypothetical protein